MTTLVLLRHGQSQWNLENRFTGWVDVDLTPEGEAQAKKGGALIQAQGVEIEAAYTSVLTRAIRTCNIALDAAGQSFVPVVKNWRLNERHYGGLTGLDKAETAAKHGDAQVKIWRRSFDVPPPPIEASSGYDFAADRRYKGAVLPVAESLADTLARVQPFWDEAILPTLKTGATTLIAAHGNSLRAVIKAVFDLSADEILQVEVPTSNPLVIALGDGLKVVSARYLDADRAEKLPAV